MRIRCLSIDSGKVRMMPERLANDKAYMQRMGLEKAEVKKPKAEKKEKVAPKKATTKAKTKK